MPRPCYSTIFEQPAAHVWSIIRDFGHYSWAGVTGETGIEGSKSGDQVGCVRAVQLNDRLIRQRLLTLSDHEWWFSYELCEPAHLPLRDYIATLRVTPITDGDKAFVQWSAISDRAETEHDRWHAHFMTSFRTWLEALRDYMNR